MKIFKYYAVKAQQAKGNDVFSFAATPDEVLSFSEIERVNRREDGKLGGFQRHQIAGHIREIRDYLSRSDALLPNAVIIAFIDGVKIKDIGNGILEVSIDSTKTKPGFVVDGQQRLTALSGIKKPGFQVFVSALICKDYNQLRQQFVLINNTRPLPKTLIYELLPNVEGLPDRYSSRSFSAKVVDLLNFTPTSNLFGEIKQHTNPTGVLSDLAIQKFVMNSASDGALREFSSSTNFEMLAYELVNNYFGAVKKVFNDSWVDMVPRTSRLKHGAGIVGMGYVMELMYSVKGASTEKEFYELLILIKDKTFWTSGVWPLADNDNRPWNGIQNTSGDINLLSGYLTRITKKQLSSIKRKA